MRSRRLALSSLVVSCLVPASLLLWGGPAPASAQQVTLEAPAGAPNVDVDPMRCWWRTSIGAVRTGETFSLTLTCAVIENNDVQVVPDETPLAGGVIAIAPFEVASSSHPPDLRTPDRRFFQYQYTLRILNAEMIGKDVYLPELILHYRINSRIAANLENQGRDLAYRLPPYVVKILPSVPEAALDIRDSIDESFGSIDALRFRASVLRIAAFALVALGALMTVVSLLRLSGRLTKRPAQGVRVLGDAAVLGAAARELDDVAQESAVAGWTENLLDRALAAGRIAAANALGRAVTQRPAGTRARSGEGHVFVPGTFFPGGKATLLSATATAEDLARAVARGASLPPERRELLLGLESAIGTLGAAHYRRDTARDRGALDDALGAMLLATRSLKSDAAWPKRFLRSLRRGGRAEQQA
ncbi:MAG: hypothetical protein EXQ48_08115 [Acidobacteria bacterium]|nr:hypothetical protein [Acidobacteriota bacterium]